MNFLNTDTIRNIFSYLEMNDIIVLSLTKKSCYNSLNNLNLKINMRQLFENNQLTLWFLKYYKYDNKIIKYIKSHELFISSKNIYNKLCWQKDNNLDWLIFLGLQTQNLALSKLILNFVKENNIQHINKIINIHQIAAICGDIKYYKYLINNNVKKNKKYMFEPIYSKNKQFIIWYVKKKLPSPIYSNIAIINALKSKDYEYIKLLIEYRKFDCYYPNGLSILINLKDIKNKKILFLFKTMFSFKPYLKFYLRNKNDYKHLFNYIFPVDKYKKLYPNQDIIKVLENNLYY